MKKYFQTPALILGLAAIYFYFGKLGLSLASVNASASAVWPPTGIMLAALLVGGNRLWPGILIGSFLVDFSTEGLWGTTLGIAAGNTLEALAAAGLVRKFAGGTKCFDRAHLTIRYVLCAAILSTLISATFGVLSLCAGNCAPWEKSWTIWSTWWIGDMTSNLVIAPLLILWLKRWPQWKKSRLVEGAGLMSVLVLTGWLVFGGGNPFAATEQLEYLSIPPLLWAAFRFGPQGAIASVFVVSGIALWGTVHGMGPFITSNPNETLLLLQSFIGVITVTVLVLAAVILERKQAEKVLMASEARLRLINEQVPAIVWTVDCNFRFTSVSGLSSLDGKFNPSQLVGRTLYDVFHTTEENYPGLAAHRRALAGIRSMVELDLGNRWWRCLIEPLLDAAGKTIGCIGVAMNITEEKKAEAKLNELADIVQSSRDAIIRVNLEFVIAIWNKGAEALFGYTSAEAVGKPIAIVLPPDRAEEADAIRVKVNRGEPVEIPETVRQGKDGTLCDVSLKISPMINAEGKLIGSTAIIRDITEKKRLEKMLLEISANERRRIGHDLHDGLGQHLAGTAFKARALEESLASESSQHAGEAGRLVNLINAGIGQTRALAQGLDPVDLELAGLPAALQKLAVQTAAEFQVACDFVCNQERLALPSPAGLALFRIAQEGIRNAISHGKARHIAIDLKSNDGRLCLTIRDDGGGFNAQENFPSGMGLRIMKYRASSVGGSLTIDSQIAHGTELICVLPQQSSLIRS